MIWFKSIFSRIIFLHVIAMVITAIFMPLGLYWFLKSAANDLHDRAMREQADLVANYLVLRPDGRWALDLPSALQDLYSEAYGRYAYAMLDGEGRVLFSSHQDLSPVFSTDARSSDVAFLRARRDNAEIAGASVAKEIDGRTGRWYALERALESDGVVGYRGDAPGAEASVNHPHPHGLTGNDAKDGQQVPRTRS